MRNKASNFIADCIIINSMIILALFVSIKCAHK